MRAANLTLRFVLEIVAFVAIGYAGWALPGPTVVRLLAAFVLVGAAVMTWSRWVAPKATHPVPDPQRLIPEWVVFGGATAAMIAIGLLVPGVVFAVLAAVNRWLLWVLKVSTGGEPVEDGGHV